MKNYRSTDYALNKYNEAIVYRNSDGSRTAVTLEQYLEENPYSTEKDYADLKELSDSIYLEQDRAEYRQTWKNISIHKLGKDIDYGELAFDELLFDEIDRYTVIKAFYKLFEEGSLTDHQERRFRLHIIKGLSHRQIAIREGVAVRAITQSIHAAIHKLKKKLNNF